METENPLPRDPHARSKALSVAAAVAILALGVGVWYSQRPAPVREAAPPAPAPAAAPAAAADATPAPPAEVATPASAPAATTAPATPAAGAARARLQQRLDALALAYEHGDARAVEAAMWPNHAVVRPDGELLERRALLAQWAEEWEGLKNRDLTFYVESVAEDAGKVVAEWTLVLTADLEGADGQTAQMMINGRQQATIVGAGDEERLDGAIAYTAFERTYNGFPWPLDNPPQ